MIIVTGATGSLNGATVNHLLQQVPPTELVVVTRDPSKAGHFADRGIDIRAGDYARPDSLPDAFDGADQLLLVSSNDPTADAVTLHRTAIDAAAAVGVGRILYTSHQGARSDSPFGPARDHALTEQALADSGVPWTSLRNGFYLHSLGWLLGQWRETGVITVPAEGRVSWTAREDAAEAAAAILLSEDPVDGPVTLTAPAAPTFAEVAETATAVIGQPVRFEIVDRDDWLAAQVAAGQPEFVARFTLGMFLAAESGHFTDTDPLLTELLGRAPRSVRDELTAPTPH